MLSVRMSGNTKSNIQILFIGPNKCGIYLLSSSEYSRAFVVRQIWKTVEYSPEYT